MKMFNAMQRPDLPGTLLFQPAALLSLPNSVEVSDAQSVNGSGVGAGSQSVKTAVGEYFERRHFYREIVSRKRGLLAESLTAPEVNSFTHALAQTASTPMSAKAIKYHRFSLIKVMRASDFSECFIPAICVSLSYSGLEKDNFLYPLRDTCGCSFYWQPNAAFLGSVKEYLERQFLVRFWLTKQCRSRVTHATITELLAGRRVRHLYCALVAVGQVSVLDISDFRFPGTCFLVVYGQKNSDHHVRYCAGMSYAADICDALEKSILELWQTYRFMDLFKAIESKENKVEDAYLRYFLSCNIYEAYREVTEGLFFVEVSSEKCKEEFSLSGLLSILNKLGVSGYFYSNCSAVNGVSCVFSKYVSPDLFLHMNTSRNINLNNKYSEGFESSILRSQLKKMVPFP
ncbi:YcaO-like family protein [Pseudomonas sp. W4I3]|uniref:YcaO-like family protein n=1 Tax=Pseudomonas sp. W4I3 TaxID=3042294 RepID=UPI00277E64C5|nr:YcaO-like family protein [Pseudomonas sp. W4I3]MDQ0741024.1 ribosomal protein S12 methylthiotransferase accessory factor YcaO [Pseudomonas sp. W4I3]